MGAQTSYGLQPALGYAGSLDKSYPHAFLTLKNVEASASIPFGVGVKRKTSSPGSEFDALLPAAETDQIAGLVVREDTYARTWVDSDGNTVGQLDANGLIPGTFFAVATKGRMLVQCDSGCNPGDGLFIRAVAGGGERLGACENADDSTDTIDLRECGTWESVAAADGLAWLSFDFTRAKQA